ncbi:hypothetical protein C8J57DRAFT_184383 [Mycena rebaudengoi]|nr:hypothetical protein C8J57DRAFT_184383 [Mycena rebaudengoi]
MSRRCALVRQRVGFIPVISTSGFSLAQRISHCDGTYGNSNSTAPRVITRVVGRRVPRCVEAVDINARAEYHGGDRRRGAHACPGS